MPKHVNVVYMHSHDTGRFIEPYGLGVSTPNFQRFANEAHVFRNAFCAAPTCSASRSALLSGQAPHVNGMIGLAHRGFRLRDTSHTLMNHLRGNGYETYLGGIQHIVPQEDIAAAGWNVVLPRSPNRQSEANEAVKLLRSKPAVPFFLDVGFNDTHLPYNPAPLSASAAVHAPPFLPDVPAVRQDFADYCQSAAQLDLHVGRVLGALEEGGLADSTIVLITTDHGIPLPNAKCNLTDAGLGVSMMMRLPQASHHVHDAMVSHLDVIPTVCELLGIGAPGWELHGSSLVPLMRGETKSVHEELFGEVTYHAAYEPMRSVRTERYKYIRRFDGRTRKVLPNCDESRSKTYLVERGWADWNVTPEYLFDLVHDPWEMRNVVSDASYASIAQEMRGRLDDWMHKTDDPLLRGPVRAPRGAKANPVDGKSPDETPITVE